MRDSRARLPELLGLPVEQASVARGCDDCGQSGYNGRLVLAELLLLDDDLLGQAILARRDVHKLEAAALESGMISRWERAFRAVEQGLTSPAEIRRVLGVSTPQAQTGPVKPLATSLKRKRIAFCYVLG